MCDEYDRLSFERLLDTFSKNVFPHMGINGRQWVIQQEDIFVGVNCSGQAHSLLLTPGQIQPSLSNLETKEQNE